ncbi:MAG: helix-turn-helix transcriptional regulator [Candidatus Dormibacteraeota bacterium]|uniref:Helix-turn-helix transcriptional regulator n=1 Tax=Candidatus Aeolococcus gillhamiae TaxID=3127015 RepID=A0A934K4R1_9BACT|nr:helix-turn-helix transcriptional regulator [Candidatus Dormibacteraeota bacterium]
MSTIQLPWQPEAAATRAIGIRIRRLRLGRFLTQEQLAQAAGLGRATIRRLEGGQVRPRLGTITALAAALDTSPEELVPDPAALWGV